MFFGLRVCCQFSTLNILFVRIDDMIITYYGMSCFKVALGDKVLAFNPPSKESKFKTPRFGAQIVISSLNHPDYNGYESLSSGDAENKTLHIYGPGEYESGGIYIKGASVKQNIFGKERYNTVYSVLFDDINICHLGALNSTDLTPEIKEMVGDVGILFTPMTGGDLLSPANASKLASTLEANIVIPASHTIDGEDKKNLNIFLKEMGQEGIKAEDKLTIKRKDLDGKNGDVVVLSPAL